jgi:hypothetical protein
MSIPTVENYRPPCPIAGAILVVIPAAIAAAAPGAWQ